MDDSERQVELADEDRCTYAENGEGRCTHARSYFFRREGTYCKWHVLSSNRADFEAVPEGERDFAEATDFAFMRFWLRSREGGAYAMFKNYWKWTSSDDWCDVFGCCGRGWAAEEDEQAFGELRAAHLLARLPVPDWITNPREYPPRRRSPEVVIAELRARVVELESRIEAEAVAPFA